MRNYDVALADSSLLQVDLNFAQKHFPQPGRLVDLGCGTGRLLIPFAARGYWCLGIDLSAPMLEVVAEKARQAGVVVQGMKANLVELDSIGDGSFDYAACLFSTFGMIRGLIHRRRGPGTFIGYFGPAGDSFSTCIITGFTGDWDLAIAARNPATAPCPSTTLERS